MRFTNSFKPIRSKVDGWQRAEKCYACSSCRAKYPATKRARCRKCNHIATAMVKTPGVKMNKNCPNCARPSLVNEFCPPFSCACGSTDFMLFDSTGEYELFLQLALLNDNGSIKNLRRQVWFEARLIGDKNPLVRMRIDFAFDDPQPDGSEKFRVVDFKGDQAQVDDLFKLKCKLIERFNPGVKIEVFTAN